MQNTDKNTIITLLCRRNTNSPQDSVLQKQILEGFAVGVLRSGFPEVLTQTVLLLSYICNKSSRSHIVALWFMETCNLVGGCQRHANISPRTSL
jgi:hypothetical protein